MASAAKISAAMTMSIGSRAVNPRLVARSTPSPRCTSVGRIFGSSQRSSGPPIRAVTAPVGKTSAVLFARSCTIPSQNQSSRPPRSGETKSTEEERRTPSARVSAGAARPMKLTRPTAEATKAASMTATAATASLIENSDTPSDRAPESPRPRTVSGLTSRPVRTSPTKS
ncbi:hypothetical protein D3C72_1573440 [compost metagenome]